MTTKQELEQAQRKLIAAIAKQKVTVRQVDNNTLELSQNENKVAIAINGSSVTSTSRSFR